MKFSLSLIALATAVISQVEKKLPTGRIVGGYEVSPKFKYPWLVSLDYKTRHSCGGTLYTANTVITAAHCTVRNTTDWTARVHRHDLNATPESEGGKFYTIKDRIAHPKYDANTNAYDAAIWKLNTPNGLPTGVLIDLGLFSNIDNLLLKVIGWGTTASGGTVSPILLEVKVPVYNIDKCKKVYSELDTETQFCAAFEEGGKDSCQGDSGGPLFVHAFDKVPVLVGIVSWGEGCALPGKPGVYTRASAVFDFINEHAWK